MNDYTYLTPKDTAAVLNTHADKCANFGLILARYTPHEVIANDDIPGERHKKYRDRWLRDLCVAFKRDNLPADLAALLRARFKRWVNLTDGAERFKLRLTSRLLVGLGGKGSLEIGLTLDHLTGLPVIPGSALKGAARNYALLMLAEKRGLSFAADTPPDTINKQLNDLEAAIAAGENLSKSEQRFRRVFGCLGEAGALVFHDAVPTGKIERGLFVADVMTPHFGEYYRSSGGKPPHDADSPNPVAFVAVDAGVEFAFAVGTRRSAAVDEKDWKFGYESLFNALTEFGIGAKTAAGYGTLKLVE